jgi:hypothetical protein
MDSCVWVTTANWRECQNELASIWLEWRDANPALSSPFFHPDFSTIVANWQANVEVGLIHDESGLVGIFPFQRLKGNIGVPVGRVHRRAWLDGRGADYFSNDRAIMSEPFSATMIVAA